MIFPELMATVAVWQDSALAVVKDTAEAARGLAGKTGAWYDRPALIAVLGMLWHTYIKWGEKKKYTAGLTLWAYALDRRRAGATVLGLTLIGCWVANVGIQGYNIRDVLPYHWVTALAVGYAMDSLIKAAVKKLPFLGTAFGIKLRPSGAANGSLTISEDMPAVPPPPGFNDNDNNDTVPKGGGGS